MKLYFYGFIVVFLVIASCANGGKEKDGENIMTCSSNIALYQREGYTEAVIYNSAGNPVAQYALVPKEGGGGIDIPDNLDEIKVPVSNLILDSEVYAGVLEELGSVEAIKGMFDSNFATSPSLRGKIEAGIIEDLGNTSSPGLEKIIGLDPDAILISYFDGMQASNLDGLGVPIIKMLDLQEPDPLGRAEWIKFIGRLIGKAEIADSIYNGVEEAYSRMQHTTGKTGSKPKILSDLMYQGVWYVPGGKSYQAQLIQDAGGEYFKKEDPTPVTLNLSSEQVLDEAGDADIWIIRHYGSEEELKTILASDPVYRQIKAYKNGQIYYSDTSTSGLFREFPFHPERLLKDYKLIFNSDTTEQPKYFNKLN